MSADTALDRDITTPADMATVLAAVLADVMRRDTALDIATVETITEAGEVRAPGLIVTTETGFTFEIAITRKDAGEAGR